ncbi:MAG: ferrochelatase [Bacteroidia bacterium]|nr:ferrochelatase [Bacteroidia bacterium]
MKGILLVNLGTPDSPSTSDVRKYLTQFLNDRRVIDISPIGRFFLVNFIIVPFRAKKSAGLYKKIWTEKGSPLLIHGNALKEKLQNELGENYFVELGMRYQSPSLETALNKLKEKKVSEIIVLPMYPQYASSSTGSSVEEVLRIIKSWEVTPSVKIINKFYDEPLFYDAWQEVAKKFNVNDFDHFVFSYHGLPERQILKASAHYGGNTCKMGDCCNKISKNNQYCYRAACFETTRQLIKKLNIPAEKSTTSFQSRLDDGWLKPYSDKVMEELPAKGNKKILVLSPAFVADCLETIYEIGTEYREIFMHAGGERFEWVESLNANPVWVKAVAAMVKS